MSVGLNCDFLIKGGGHQKQHKAALLVAVWWQKPPQKYFWGLTLFLGQGTRSGLVYEPFNPPCFTQMLPEATAVPGAKGGTAVSDRSSKGSRNTVSKFSKAFLP